MMKLILVLSFLTVTQLSDAMNNRRVVLRKTRVDDQVSFNDGMRIIQSFETDYSEDGREIPNFRQRKSLKDLLYRNFIKDKNTQDAGILLVLSVLTGINSISNQKSSRWHNQTDTCPAMDYCAARERLGFVQGGAATAAGIASIFCCNQFIKTITEYCNCNAEHEA